MGMGLRGIVHLLNFILRGDKLRYGEHRGVCGLQNGVKVGGGTREEVVNLLGRV